MADEAMTWAIGVFRTASDDFGDDVGDEGESSLTTRVTWTPYYDEGSGGRYLLHLGSGYSFRDADEGVVRFRERPEVRMRAAGEGDVPRFVDTGIMPADHHQLFGAEAALVWGSFSLQSEYIAAVVDSGATGDPTLDGVYVYASYFLTGEHRNYNRQTGAFDRVRPLENFFSVCTEDKGVCTGWGAWELKARWSYLDLNDSSVEGGRLSDVTLGLNWYFRPPDLRENTMIPVSVFRDADQREDELEGCAGVRCFARV